MTGPGVDWRTIASALPGCVAVLEADTFVYAAPELAAALDHDPETLEGERWETLLEDPLARTLRSALERTDDGDWSRPILITARDSGDTLTVVVARINDDVVVWHRTEHALDSVSNHEDPIASLTARQREVLESAYEAGYYEWPREQTAVEIADDLDIAPPTLHAHLRKAEDRLLTALLESNE